jgi:pilus assembly protein CpaC
MHFKANRLMTSMQSTRWGLIGLLAAFAALTSTAQEPRSAATGQPHTPSGTATATLLAPLPSGEVVTAAGAQLTVGKSTVLRLPEIATRLSIGNPEVADVMLINPREVYLLGKKPGTTNLFVWTPNGSTTIRDVDVHVDVQHLQARLKRFVPSAESLQVEALSDRIVLSGQVSDALKAQRLVHLSEAFISGVKVINLLRIDGAQQVMLEVKVAEVSKTLLEQIGVDLDITRTTGGTSVRFLSQLLSSGSSSVSFTRPDGRTSVTVNADMKKGLVKVLAEPTITAINGQEGSFLAGGKIFIPVPQTSSSGGTVITLEEKEFGVGLRFLPTVLEDGVINLRVTPEVSELSQIGTTITGLTGQTSLLPSITTRRASTTVQLRDGESFAIGGLIKSNVSQSVKAIPLLGDIPVLGALFRSTAFQTEKSELMFIVTPRLAKPLSTAQTLPTDRYIQPSRAEMLLEGRLEGRGPELATPAVTATPAAQATDAAVTPAPGTASTPDSKP